MPDPLVKSLSELPVGGMPACTITQVTPLLVTFDGVTSVPGDKVAGLAYTLDGRCRALMDSPNKPLIIPIG